MNWDPKKLRLLGLRQTEIKILKAISSPKNVQDIARSSGISRTGIKHCLNNLTFRGIVKTVHAGIHKSYASISSKEITKSLLLIASDIGDAQPGDLIHVKITQEKKFVLHIGSKEIIPAYQRIALTNKNERIRAIQHHKSWNELLKKISKSQLIEFNESIIKNHLVIDGILNESAYDAYIKEIQANSAKQKDLVESLNGRMADYTVFPDNFFNYDSEIWIFKTTALIISWKNEVAIEITDKNIIGLIKDMFDLMKNSGRKIDHNQLIKKVLGFVNKN
ncbi:MAG: hypothetical protein NT077_03680 [Candidatus Taylorbacteria bacterium]|nr:hypothetical protein [Candidatus Taylorbacteria bacterium]